MQSCIKLFIGLSCIVSLTLAGCGGAKYPTVSGKVTAAGEPVPNVRVTFAPKAVGDNNTPGPYSIGTTDQNGVYELTTRYKEPGAVVGPHKISFEWANRDFDEMKTLRRDLKNAEGDEAKRAEIQEQIKELRQTRKSLPKVDIDKIESFTVPAEGADNADFEIGTGS